eukprot:2661853-Amphidinium_carterae.1
MICNGKVLEWFHSPLEEVDTAILDIDRGESSAQQAAECLAKLVALRIWKPHWQQDRITLT